MPQEKPQTDTVPMPDVPSTPTTAPTTALGGIDFSGQPGTAPIHLATEDADAAADAAPQNIAPPDAANQDATPKPTSPPVKMSPLPPLPGMAEHAFRAMSYVPPLFLLLILGLQTVTGLLFPSLYLPVEATVAQAYDAMLQKGQWIIPPVSEALPTALPGYFWFLRVVEALPGLEIAFFLPLAAFGAALAALMGTYVLGRCTGLDARVSFAAGLILLSCPGFVPLAHGVVPDLLTAGLLALSLAFLHVGWKRERAVFALGLGFILAALAALTGGLVALWIPLTASVALLLWRGTPRRGHRLDAVWGFGLLMACIAVWLAAAILLTGESAKTLEPLFAHILAPLLPPVWPPRDVWWISLALLPLALLPWALVPLFVSWGRVLAGSWAAIKASRQEHTGAAWLWICLISGLALFTLSSHKPLLIIVPLLPVASLLLARALLGLPHARSRAFYLLVAFLSLLGGSALIVLGIPPAASLLQNHLADTLPPPYLDALMAAQGLPVLGAIAIVGALALYRLTNRAFAGGALTVCVLVACMLVQPATLLTGPSLAGVAGVPLPGGMGMMPAKGTTMPPPPPVPVDIPMGTPEAAPEATPEAAPVITPEAVPAPTPEMDTPEPEATPPAPENLPEKPAE